MYSASALHHTAYTICYANVLVLVVTQFVHRFHAHSTPTSYFCVFFGPRLSVFAPNEKCTKFYSVYRYKNSKHMIRWFNKYICFTVSSSYTYISILWYWVSFHFVSFMPFLWSVCVCVSIGRFVVLSLYHIINFAVECNYICDVNHWLFSTE